MTLERNNFKLIVRHAIISGEAHTWVDGFWGVINGGLFDIFDEWLDTIDYKGFIDQGCGEYTFDIHWVDGHNEISGYWPGDWEIIPAGFRVIEITTHLY